MGRKKTTILFSLHQEEAELISIMDRYTLIQTKTLIEMTQQKRAHTYYYLKKLCKNKFVEKYGAYSWRLTLLGEKLQVLIDEMNSHKTEEKEVKEE